MLTLRGVKPRHCHDTGLRAMTTSSGRTHEPGRWDQALIPRTMGVLSDALAQLWGLSGRNADGRTRKRFESARTWFLVSDRVPFRTAEIVDCEMPTFSRSSRPLGESIRCSSAHVARRPQKRPAAGSCSLLIGLDKASQGIAGFGPDNCVVRRERNRTQRSSEVRR